MTCYQNVADHGRHNVGAFEDALWSNSKHKMFHGQLKTTQDDVEPLWPMPTESSTLALTTEPQMECRPMADLFGGVKTASAFRQKQLSPNKKLLGHG